jgi:hypothetical protein
MLRARGQRDSGVSNYPLALFMGCRISHRFLAENTAHTYRQRGRENECGSNSQPVTKHQRPKV